MCTYVHDISIFHHDFCKCLDGGSTNIAGSCESHFETTNTCQWIFTAWWNQLSKYRNEITDVLEGKWTAPEQWIKLPWNCLSHGLGIGKEVWLHLFGWCSSGTCQQSTNHYLVYLAYHWAQRPWTITGAHPSWSCKSRASRKKFTGGRLEITTKGSAETQPTVAAGYRLVN
jgi:hypothetical protein